MLVLNFATAARFPNPARCLSDSMLLIGRVSISSLVNKLSSVAQGKFDKLNFPKTYSLPVWQSKTWAAWKPILFYKTTQKLAITSL